jgi:hypothetical protein
VEKRGDAVVLYLPDGTNVNEELIRSGFAKPKLAGSEPEFTRYSALLDAALKQKLGIWGGRGATPEDASVRQIIDAVEEETARERGIASGSITLSAGFKFGDGSLHGVVESRVIEKNSTWWKYAWKVTLTNKGKTARSTSAMVEFQDSDGFPVNQASTEATTIDPGETQILTGLELIAVSSAPKVRKVDLKLRPAR